MTQTNSGAAPAAPATWAERLRGLESAAAVADTLVAVAAEFAALGDLQLPRASIGLEVKFGLGADRPRNAELRSAVNAVGAAFGLVAMTDQRPDHPSHSTPYVGSAGVRVYAFLNKKDHEPGRVNTSGGRYQVMCTCGEWASGWHGTEELAREDHDRHARGVDRVEIGIDKCGCIVTAEVDIQPDGGHAEDWNDGTDRTEHGGTCSLGAPVHTTRPLDDRRPFGTYCAWVGGCDAVPPRGETFGSLLCPEHADAPLEVAIAHQVRLNWGQPEAGAR